MSNVVAVREGRLVGSFVGALGSPDGVATIVLHGSDGQVRTEWARLLAGAGVDAFALQWFRAPGLPEEIEEIPLELLSEAVEWTTRRTGKRVALLGHSKGAELALLTATLLDCPIAGVAVWSASSVAWQGFRLRTMQPSSGHSSWTLGGNPVPFIAGDDFLNDPEAFESAQIPIERFRGPVLVFSGSDDRVWPAMRMGQMLVDRASAKGEAGRVEHVVFDGAGHMITPDLRGRYIPLAGYDPPPPSVDVQRFVGGAPTVDANAADRSSALALAFLSAL
jgi:acetyl esterase/lipase